MTALAQHETKKWLSEQTASFYIAAQLGRKCFIFKNNNTNYACFLLLPLFVPLLDSLPVAVVMASAAGLLSLFSSSIFSS